MNVGEALATLDALRPGSRVAPETRCRWLRELDGTLRLRFFRKSSGAWESVGADLAQGDGRLPDDTVLLAPAPFDALYPHYLCAMNDAALGETDRYAGEQAQYNSILAELSAWLRREHPPCPGAQWRW